MLKCSNMVNSVHSHDLGTIGALETTFLENRFSILARMRRVMRTHPLKGLLTIGQNRFETSGRVGEIESNESTSEAAGTRGLPVRQCWNSVSRLHRSYWPSDIEI